MVKPFTGKMEYDPEVNLWVARKADEIQSEVRDAKFRRGILKRRKRTATIYDRHGRPVCQVRVNDSGQGAEHEFDSHQDAVVKPFPIEIATSVRK